MLGGIWQSLLGLAGVAKVIKFTPHPVLVGFLNGVAVLVALSQLKPYFLTSATASNLTLFDRPWQFLLPARRGGFDVAFSGRRQARSKLTIACQGSRNPCRIYWRIVAFYFFKGVRPDVDLGPTIGNVSFVFPLFSLSSGEAWQNIARTRVGNRPNLNHLSNCSDYGFSACVSCRAKRQRTTSIPYPRFIRSRRSQLRVGASRRRNRRGVAIIDYGGLSCRWPNLAHTDFISVILAGVSSHFSELSCFEFLPSSSPAFFSLLAFHYLIAGHFRSSWTCARRLRPLIVVAPFTI